MSEISNFEEANDIFDRESPEVVLKEPLVLKSVDFVQSMMDALPHASIILNTRRQIVLVNKNFKKLFKVEDKLSILGRQLGQVVACVYSVDDLKGCRCGEGCKFCDVLKSVLQNQVNGEQVTKEACLQIRGDRQINMFLRVTSALLTIHDQKFTLVSFEDITIEKQRSALERIFFHDIIDVAGSLHGILEMIKSDPEENLDLFEIVPQTSQILIDIIRNQQAMLMLNNRLIKTRQTMISLNYFIQETVNQIKYHEVCSNRDIKIVQGREDLEVLCDKILLQRVLNNMLKNAIEAVDGGEQVSIGVEENDNSIDLWVRNDCYISIDVQEKIFKTTITTKGKGRGIGTYSMKLIAEKYLNSCVFFESTPLEGTIFTLRIPK